VLVKSIFYFQSRVSGLSEFIAGKCSQSDWLASFFEAKEVSTIQVLTNCQYSKFDSAHQVFYDPEARSLAV